MRDEPSHCLATSLIPPRAAGTHDVTVWLERGADRSGHPVDHDVRQQLILGETASRGRRRSRSTPGTSRRSMLRGQRENRSARRRQSAAVSPGSSRTRPFPAATAGSPPDNSPLSGPEFLRRLERVPERNIGQVDSHHRAAVAPGKVLGDGGFPEVRHREHRSANSRAPGSSGYARGSRIRTGYPPAFAPRRTRTPEGSEPRRRTRRRDRLRERRGRPAGGSACRSGRTSPDSRGSGMRGSGEGPRLFWWIR